jgi:hypothetical protein
MRLASLGLDIGIFVIFYIRSPIEREFGARFIRAGPFPDTAAHPEIIAPTFAVPTSWTEQSGGGVGWSGGVQV